MPMETSDFSKDIHWDDCKSFLKTPQVAINVDLIGLFLLSLRSELEKGRAFPLLTQARVSSPRDASKDASRSPQVAISTCGTFTRHHGGMPRDCAEGGV